FNNLTTGAGSSYWTFGDGGNSFATSPAHTYFNNGIYTMTLVSTSADGCKDTVTRIDTVFDLTLAAHASPNEGCVPLEVRFETFASTTIPFYRQYPYDLAFWSWNFGDGNTSNLDTPIHTYTNPGTYTVVVTTTTINGCITT